MPSPIDPAMHGPRGRFLASMLLALWGLAGCSNQASSSEEKRASHPPEPPKTSQAAMVEEPPTPEIAREDTPAPSEPTDPPAPEPLPTFGPAELTPLDDEERATLASGPSDDPIPVEIHYVQSNETRHDLFFEHIDGVGGAYIGVGSDQNFTMIAKARSELAFLMDIDFRVVDLHRMYQVMIPHAETPEALVDMWDEAHEDETSAFLAEALQDYEESDRGRILRGYKSGRETVFLHLKRVIHRTVDGEPASWLSNPEMYAHVRSLYQTGRVRVFPGNLVGDKTLQTVASVTQSLDVPVRVLYMSNAEEYFKYTPQFVSNIEALPTDERSMILRTIYSKKWEHADLWAYQVQPLADFEKRLGDRKNRSRNAMFRYASHEGALDRETARKGFSAVGLPQDS